MNKKIITIFSLLIILAFIGYILYDMLYSGADSEPGNVKSEISVFPDQWIVSKEILSDDGPLSSVAVSGKGLIYLGGDSFISCYNKEMNKLWVVNTPAKITSLSAYGDTLYAATSEMIMLFSNTGKQIEEWGPFEDNSIITSVASNKTFVVFADAGNKILFVLRKDGRVRSMIGQSGEKFIIPSLFFDVAIDEADALFIANTGHRRVEKRSIDGQLISYFGESGLAHDAFCGCCNPAHFVLTPDGFITSEKGINRIKILNKEGGFIEFVSSKNNFEPPVPLDLATDGGVTIYAANPSDSKLYVFKRKE